MSSDRQWTGKAGGTPWMQRTLISMFKVVPLPVMYFFMSFTIPYYLIAHRSAVKAIYSYFRRRRGYSMLKAALHTVWNHCVFGAVVMDKFAAYAGRKFKITVENQERFEQLSHKDEGFIMLTAHIGNSEISGYSLTAPKRMNVLAFGGETETVSGSRAKRLTENNIRLIPTDDGMEYLFTINSAIGNGEIISLHADRVFGSPKTVSTSLLGGKACLPCGPFALRLATETDAVSVFVMKESLHRYRIYIDDVADGDSDCSKDERLQVMARSFCRNLEKALEKHPDQWFNYYEFWND